MISARAIYDRSHDILINSSNDILINSSNDILINSSITSSNDILINESAHFSCSKQSPASDEFSKSCSLAYQ